MASKLGLDVSDEVRDALLGYLKDSIASGVRMAEALGYDPARAKLEEAAAELSLAIQFKVVPMRGGERERKPCPLGSTKASSVPFIDRA